MMLYVCKQRMLWFLFWYVGSHLSVSKVQLNCCKEPLEGCLRGQVQLLPPPSEAVKGKQRKRSYTRFGDVVLREWVERARGTESGEGHQDGQRAGAHHA